MNKRAKMAWLLIMGATAGFLLESLPKGIHFVFTTLTTWPTGFMEWLKALFVPFVVAYLMVHGMEVWHWVRQQSRAIKLLLIVALVAGGGFTLEEVVSLHAII